MCFYPYECSVCQLGRGKREMIIHVSIYKVVIEPRRCSAREVVCPYSSVRHRNQVQANKLPFEHSARFLADSPSSPTHTGGPLRCSPVLWSLCVPCQRLSSCVHTCCSASWLAFWALKAFSTETQKTISIESHCYLKYKGLLSICPKKNLQTNMTWSILPRELVCWVF